MASIDVDILDYVSHSICSQCGLKLLCDYPSIILDSQQRDMDTIPDKRRYIHLRVLTDDTKLPDLCIRIATRPILI